MVETEMEIQPDGMAGGLTRTPHRTETASAQQYVGTPYKNGQA
jgi:hypothetical protein